MKISSALIFSILIFCACNNQFSKVVKSKDKEYKLKMAEQYYAKKDYVKAQQLYTDIMPFFKGDPRFEDIYYKFAYTAYYQKDYENAENLFKTYTENFPNSARVDECEYMRCICYYKQSPNVNLDQTNTSKTISLMQAFINTHPDSKRVPEATAIIDECRKKLELKEFNNASLYYNLGFYKSAGVAFSVLIDDFPDSERGDEYAFNSIKAYYKYAEMSVVEKQEERYDKVVSDANDFQQRFAESKFMPDVNEFKTNSENFLKKIQNQSNEQNKATTGR